MNKIIALSLVVLLCGVSEGYSSDLSSAMGEEVGVPSAVGAAIPAAAAVDGVELIRERLYAPVVTSCGPVVRDGADEAFFATARAAIVGAMLDPSVGKNPKNWGSSAVMDEMLAKLCVVVSCLPPVSPVGEAEMHKALRGEFSELQGFRRVKGAEEYTNTMTMLEALTQKVIAKRIAIDGIPAFVKAETDKAAWLASGGALASSPPARRGEKDGEGE